MKRVYTEGQQGGPCPLCGGTGDYTADGGWGGGWTGSDWPGFTHTVCANARDRAQRESGQRVVPVGTDAHQVTLGLDS